MSAVAVARALALALALALASAPSIGAAQASRLRVTLLLVSDDTGTASPARLRKLVSEALAGEPSLELVSRRALAREARALRIPQTQWLEAGVLQKLAAVEPLDAVLSARLSPRRTGVLVTLEAYSPSSGAGIAEAGVELARPNPSAAVARELVQAIAAELRQRVSPTAAPAEAPAEAPAAGSAWASDEDWGQSPSEPPEATSAAGGGRSLALGGKVTTELFAYPRAIGAEKVPGRSEVGVELTARGGSAQAFGFARLVVRRDFADPERDRTDLDEAYAELSEGAFTLRVGRVVVAWGAAGLMNPSDVLNPQDLRDPVDPVKHGTLMLRLAAGRGPLHLEAYYLPVPEGHLLPLADGLGADYAWTGRSRWVTGGLELPPGTPAGVPVTLRQSGEPRPPSLEHGQGALRLAASGLGVDASVGYAYLFDRYPTATATLSPTPVGLDLALTLRYPRLHVFTADLETTIGKLRLAAEGAAFVPRNDDLVRFATVVAGGDFRTSAFAGEHALHLFLDVVVTRALSGSLPDDEVGELRFPLEQAALVRLAYEIGTSLRLELDAALAYEPRGAFVHGYGEYTFLDQVKLQLGYLWIDGDPGTFFARFRDNSRVTASAEVSF